jgi:hypothetical protein
MLVGLQPQEIRLLEFSRKPRCLLLELEVSGCIHIRAATMSLICGLWLGT